MYYLAGQNLAGQTGDAEAEGIAETQPLHWFKEYEYAEMDEIRSHTSLKGLNGYEIFFSLGSSARKTIKLLFSSLAIQERHWSFYTSC